MERPFCQVDVFADELYLGNPVAVVLDGKGLRSLRKISYVMPGVS